MEENKELNADCVINTLTDGADKPDVKLTEKMQAEVKRMAKEYIIPKLDYTHSDYNAHDMMEAFEEGYKTAMCEIHGASIGTTNMVEWNDARKILPEFSEENNAVICVDEYGFPTIQFGRLADKTRWWSWLKGILLPVPFPNFENTNKG